MKQTRFKPIDLAAGEKARARSALANAGQRNIVYFRDGSCRPAIRVAEEIGLSQQTVWNRYKRLRELKAEVTIDALKQRPAK